MDSTNRSLALTFDPVLDELASRKELRDGLSAVLQVGANLWVANDESSTVERLTIEPGGAARRHVQFALADYLDLPLPPPDKSASAPEVDVEGLDHDGGYLWMAGSHSLKRDKPGKGDDGKAARRALRSVSRDANRYLLARIPMAQAADGNWTLARTHQGADGTLRAARLRGASEGNELMRVLRRDRHLRDFMGVPGKENGFDIEGLAVRGERVFLGLRGPVLRGWALILELRVTAARKAGRLRLRDIDDKGRRVRKHFLDLGGRGVRDIHLDGDDLLVLAGPTMPLDGQLSVLRWPGALQQRSGCLVRQEQLQHVLDLPHGDRCDQAEGITVFHAPQGSQAPALLVVHDSASPERQVGDSTLLADVVALPPAFTAVPAAVDAPWRPEAAAARPRARGC